MVGFQVDGVRDLGRARGLLHAALPEPLEHTDHPHTIF